MRPKITMTVKDRGWKKINDLYNRLRNGKIYVKAGVLSGSDSRSDTMDNVTLALIHEFGTGDGRIPARSFVRSTFADNRPNYEAQLKQVVVKAFGKDPDLLIKGLNLIGLAMASDMKKRITLGAGVPPPNAPSTIKAKGSSRPLVDTGQLVRSITHAVVEE